jgi:hypothetical protein
MVTDLDFWVRRRSAEALVALGAVSAASPPTADLAAVSAGSPPTGDLAAVDDAYARDALVEAIADARFTGLGGWPALRTTGPRVVG